MPLAKTRMTVVTYSPSQISALNPTVEVKLSIVDQQDAHADIQRRLRRVAEVSTIYISLATLFNAVH